VSKENVTASAPVHQLVGRSPLGRGNRYQFPGYDAGFLVTFVAIPGHKEHDGGLPGVGIEWIGHNFHRRKKRAFYIFKSEADFWDSHLFKCAVDAPNDKVDLAPASGAQVQRLVGRLCGDITTNKTKTKNVSGKNENKS
jgi:hypothetical protein